MCETFTHAQVLGAVALASISPKDWHNLMYQAVNRWLNESNGGE